VVVRDFSAETLRTIAAHLEASTDFEHLVYREAELDAIWSITGFFLTQRTQTGHRPGGLCYVTVDDVDAVRRLHEGAHRAHDLVAARRPREAAALLRALL